MNVAAANNEAGCRPCQLSSCKTQRSRHLTVAVTSVQLLVMMLCCRIRDTAAAVHQSETVAMVADDAVLWTQSDDSVSLSLPVAEWSPENADHGRLASLLHRDRSPGRVRAGTGGRRALIAVHRPPGSAGPGRGAAAALARPRVVNKVKPPATLKTGVAAAARLKLDRADVTPVITAPDHIPPIQIRSTSLRDLSSISVTHNGLGSSHHQPDDSYSLTSAASSSVAHRGSVSSFQQLSNESVQSSSIRLETSDSRNKFTARNTVADDVTAPWNIPRDDANLEIGRGLVRRRARKQSEDSVASDQHTARYPGVNLLVTTYTDRMSTESSTARLRTAEAPGSADVPLGAAALRYRSRSNLAALVDPLNSRGRALASASANKWRHLATVSDNSTSSAPVIEEMPASSAAGFYNDSDSVEVEVLKMHVNNSVGAENSTSVASRPLSDDRKPANSTLSPSGEWNCGKETNGLGLRSALRSRTSASTAAAFVYTISFLFAIVSASAITGVILSLCLRNQRSSPFTGRRLSFQLVLGFLAIAAAARALYYVDAQYQLMAATPSGRRAIYECFFPLLIATFFVHGRLSCGEAVRRTSPIRFRCNACVVGLLLCFYMILVLSVSLLIEFCIVPGEAVFVLRLVFALFAILLSLANIHRIATSSRRHIATQVLICALFVICAGSSAVDAATLLSSNLALLLRQKADVLIAVEAADILAEFVIFAVLCAMHASSTFSRFQCEEGRKSVDAGCKKIPGSRIDDGKSANHGQGYVLSKHPPQRRHLCLSRLLGCSSKNSKVLDVGSAPQQMSLDVVSAVGWASTEDLDKVDGVSPLPLRSRVTRSRYRRRR